MGGQCKHGVPKVFHCAGCEDDRANPYASESTTLHGDDAKHFLEEQGLQPIRNPLTTAFRDPSWQRDASDTIGTTLNERQGTHGDYSKTAATAQSLKAVLADSCSLPTPAMRESLDLICTKLARIVNGNPYCEDHVLDIIGYAKLVADRLEPRG
jgi:hypothetical protein